MLNSGRELTRNASPTHYAHPVMCTTLLTSMKSMKYNAISSFDSCDTNTTSVYVSCDVNGFDFASPTTTVQVRLVCESPMVSVTCGTDCTCQVGAQHCLPVRHFTVAS